MGAVDLCTQSCEIKVKGNKEGKNRQARYNYAECGSLLSFPLCRTYDMDAIAINKLCKFYFRYFTMYLAIRQHRATRAFLSINIVC